MCMFGNTNSGAEDLLPIFMYCLLKSGLKNVCTECHFMEDFLPKAMKLNENGYALAVFSSCARSVNDFTM